MQVINCVFSNVNNLKKVGKSISVNLKMLLLLVGVFSMYSGVAQEFRVELKYVDVSDGFVNAGLNTTQIQKSQFDDLVTKLEAAHDYSVKSEFTDAKNCGFISIKSNAKSSISEFQKSLAQVGIYNVTYNGQVISTQKIESNYVPINKTEVKKIDRK